MTFIPVLYGGKTILMDETFAHLKYINPLLKELHQLQLINFNNNGVADMSAKGNVFMLSAQSHIAKLFEKQRQEIILF